MTPRVSFETLGCKLNQYETDAIAASFRDLGWTIVEPGEASEAHVVNTCTVTNRADQKSRHALMRGLRHPIVVVTGCFAESARDDLEEQKGVTFVVPNDRKNQIAALVDSHLKGEVASSLPAADPFGFPTHEKVFHTRASVKIQDGCDNFCSFCIIPQVRGRAVSRPLAAILQATRELVAMGRKEIVLTGVNLGRWAQDNLTFTDLVAALLALDGDFRLRITSLEPEGLGEDFARLLVHPKMCPHLHLCLQSGSPRVLLAMRRQYTLDQFEALVALLRSARPELTLTTDVIVGFPGETEEELRQTVAVVEGLGFAHVHVFPYSRRQDTRAERMEGQVPAATKAQRSRVLQNLAHEQRGAILAAVVGRRRVLVETANEGRPEGGWLRGLSEDYFPVRFRGSTPWNQFQDVAIVGATLEGEEWVLEGRP